MIAKHKVARYFWKWVLQSIDMWAIALPWGTICYLEEHFENEGLRMHEYVHIQQYARDGRIVFLIKYFYYLLKVGYWNNPYEIEARVVSGYPQ